MAAPVSHQSAVSLTEILKKPLCSPTEAPHQSVWCSICHRYSRYVINGDQKKREQKIVLSLIDTHIIISPLMYPSIY